jgi:hypothetical protein
MITEEEWDIQFDREYDEIVFECSAAPLLISHEADKIILKRQIKARANMPFPWPHEDGDRILSL